MDVADQFALIENKLASFREDISVRDEAPDSVRRATTRIHEALFNPALTVTGVREDLGLTGATFSTRFRHHHGCTPAQYIRRLRVQAAKRLLQHEDLRTADIAFHVGYEHYRTFARVFKRLTGRSPQAFREHRQSS